MEQLLAVRKTIKDFFTGYDLYIIPCLKFVLAFFVFVLINRNYMYMERLSNVFILIVLALLCAILPINAIVVISAILLILHCFAADLVIGIGAFLLMLILVILLLRFAPKDSLAVILTPFAFMFNIPAAIPIGLGIVRDAASVIAGICGVVVYSFLDSLPRLVRLAESEGITKIKLAQEMIQSLIGHEELILSSIVFTAVILVVHLIRSTLTKYAYLIATAAGAVLYIILRCIGSRMLDVNVEISKIITGTLLSFILCIVIVFFLHCADYSRTKLLQFEDDEYYYYVKAVPKRTPEDSLDEVEEAIEEIDSSEGFELVKPPRKRKIKTEKQQNDQEQ